MISHALNDAFQPPTTLIPCGSQKRIYSAFRTIESEKGNKQHHAASYDSTQATGETPAFFESLSYESIKKSSPQSFPERTCVIDVGGGLRGSYAAGVLDYCHDTGITTEPLLLNIAADLKTRDALSENLHNNC